MQWLKPYEVKHTTALIFFERLQIIFEDTAIYEVLCGIGSYKKTKEHFDMVCAMLNGAYNLGHAQGRNDERKNNS